MNGTKSFQLFHTVCHFLIQTVPSFLQKNKVSRPHGTGNPRGTTQIAILKTAAFLPVTKAYAFTLRKGALHNGK